MSTEIESSSETETWELVPKEKRQNTIPVRGYSKLYVIQPETSNIKARYVAESFAEIERIECSDTFTPRSKRKNFKNLQALSAIKNFIEYKWM